MKQQNFRSIFGGLLDVIFIWLGSYIFFGYAQLTITQWYLPVLITLTGVFSLPKAGEKVSILPSVVLILSGLFLIARYFGIINAPILRYGLGGSLMVIGSVNLIRLIMTPKQ